MTMSNAPPAPSLEYPAEVLAQHIMDDDKIGAICKKVAQDRSGTRFWTPEQWEQNENTAQYDLYWAVYTETQVKIVTIALGKIANITYGG
ncbi:hypothetical protein LCGC14_3083880 [marine sediment metagenome]|uniref:Uncharacterized protein n=1 Tax=marine sediment metagenome TaxID=412755 RepID=A0A0F8Z372_9ZZZZ